MLVAPLDFDYKDAHPKVESPAVHGSFIDKPHTDCNLNDRSEWVNAFAFMPNETMFGGYFADDPGLGH